MCKITNLDASRYANINSESTRDLQVKHKAIKLLKGSMRGNLHDLESENEFSDAIPVLVSFPSW
jgi:hypothetical protein